jgi:hypothetical protein
VITRREICEAYNVTTDLAKQPVEEQMEFFYKIFPRQVDVGEKLPNTFDWILTRTRDGSRLNVPRELIHFLNSLRDTEIRRLEIGEKEPDGTQLFSHSSFKTALFDVSKTRLIQTIYAEYASQKKWLEKLQGARTKQTPGSLAEIWNVKQDEATTIANALATIGFFEIKGNPQNPQYWVPFLYRDALEMVQGSA